MFEKNRKGFVTLFMNPLFWVLVLILGIFFILSLLGFAFFLAANIFVLLGAFLIIIGAVGFLMKLGKPDVAFTFIGLGILLLVLPALFEWAGGVTLAAVMP